MRITKTLAAIATGTAAVLGLGIVGVVTQSADSPQAVAADAAATFEATFDTASDFYNRFDQGWSGWVPGQNGASSTITTFHGDHAASVPCGGPTTDRNVHVSGPKTAFDFSEAFWWCAPSGDPSTGHIMTGLDTTGYNIAWFSPKPEFAGVVKVCWDINETLMSRRKWTQLVFVTHADAVKYPSGGPTSQPEGIARGTGGFDLGYVNPDFSDPNGVSDGIIPSANTSGLRFLDGSINSFQGTNWVQQFVGPNGADRDQNNDKAARYTQCVEQTGSNTLTITRGTAQGTEIYQIAGHIPSGVIRVVFQDDEYDGMKDDRYSANVLTWHWDNIQVYTASGPPPTTTPPSSTTTTVPPTTQPSTTTTTQPTTTTSSTTTTTLPPTTTTTAPPTTTTTVPDPCPSTFNAEEHAWCSSVEARLAGS